jgi:hypothetical protein
VGVGARRITGYYNKLLDDRTATLDEKDLVDPVVKGQIEKVVFCNSLNLEEAYHG